MSSRLDHSVQPLSRPFFDVPALTLANNLLGRLLVSHIDGEITAGIVVETEAYLSSNDPASHAARGKTPRTEIQWGLPGFTYVYLIYGMYHCMNIVSDPQGTAGCVLLRALEPIHGLEVMRQRRPKAKNDEQLCNGPGKLTAALGINREHHATDLTQNLLFVCNSIEKQNFEVVRSSRIGLTDGIELPYRFYIRDNSYVSK